MVILSVNVITGGIKMRELLLKVCIFIALFVVVFQVTKANTNDIIIEVYEDGKFGNTNLLVNPDFEEGSIGWTAETARPDLFIYEIDDENTISGKKSAYIAANDGTMSGYWAQTVKLIPGEKYKCSIWGDITRGYILLYVNGNGINDRRYLSARYDDAHYPVFIKADHRANLAENGWNKYQLEFTNVKNAPVATIHLGIYFSEGEAYFDNIYFGITDVKVAVIAKNPKGIPITRIVIFDESDKIVFDKSYNDQNIERQELINLPADASYFKIIAYDNDGNQKQVIFPHVIN